MTTAERYNFNPPEIVPIYDESFGERFETFELDTERLQDIIGVNLERQPRKDTLIVDFQDGSLQRTQNKDVEGRYDYFRSLIQVGVPEQKYPNPLGALDRVLLHETGHYIMSSGLSIPAYLATFNSYQRLIPSLAVAAAVTVGSLPVPDSAFPIDKVTLDMGILGVGAAASMIGVAAVNRVGPRFFREWADIIYENDPEEIYAREFESREGLKLEDFLIIAKPRSEQLSDLPVMKL